MSGILTITYASAWLAVMSAYLAGMASLGLILGCGHLWQRRAIRAAKTWERRIRRESDAAQRYEARKALRRLGSQVKPE